MKIKCWVVFVFNLAWFVHAAPTRVLFLGDTGLGDSKQYAVARAMARYCQTYGCDLALLLGDNFYPKGVASTADPQWKSAFLTPYSELNLMFYPVLGNHDHEGNIQAQIAYSALSMNWNMPARFHTFSRGDTQFFLIDTTRWDSEQRQWLRVALDASQAVWKIVAGHHPVFSYGSHGNTETLVNELAPILRGRANFYLCGHDHDRQVLKDSVDRSIHYIVSGAGSKTRPTQGGKLSEFHAATLGFSHLTIEGDQAHLQIIDSQGAIEYDRRFVARTLISHRRTASGR